MEKHQRIKDMFQNRLIQYQVFYLILNHYVQIREYQKAKDFVETEHQKFIDLDLSYILLICLRLSTIMNDLHDVKIIINKIDKHNFFKQENVLNGVLMVCVVFEYEMFEEILQILVLYKYNVTIIRLIYSCIKPNVP
jgi:hypothetical protein